MNPNLKLDLDKLKERSMMDKKEKTLTDLKSKIKINDSKATGSIFGGNSLMKSNLMKADTLMNFRLNENTDTTELKRVLLSLISDT